MIDVISSQNCQEFLKEKCKKLKSNPTQTHQEKVKPEVFPNEVFQNTVFTKPNWEHWKRQGCKKSMMAILKNIEAFDNHIGDPFCRKFNFDFDWTSKLYLDCADVKNHCKET